MNQTMKQEPGHKDVNRTQRGCAGQAGEDRKRLQAQKGGHRWCPVRLSVGQTLLRIGCGEGATYKMVHTWPGGAVSPTKT